MSENYKYSGFSEKEVIEANREKMGSWADIYKETMDLELFFKLSLYWCNSPDMYCPGYMPTHTNVFHFAYRLSDFLPREEREKIAVYPSDIGALIIGDLKWETLEQWRKWWEKSNTRIPELAELLRSGYLPENAKALPELIARD